MIEGETGIADIIDGVCTEYDVEPERAREEVSRFIDKLQALKLVVKVPETGAEVSR